MRLTPFVRCWKHPDGSYVFSNVDYSQIRLRITNTDKPYIEFKLKDKITYPYKVDGGGDNVTENEYNSFMSIEGGIYSWVDYITIYCKESDFPADVSSLKTI